LASESFTLRFYRADRIGRVGTNTRVNADGDIFEFRLYRPAYVAQLATWHGD